MYMSKTRVKSARNWNTRPPTHSCQRFGRKELRRKEIAKTVFREREREKDSIFLCWYNRSEKTKIKSFLGKQRGSWFFFWSNNLFSLSLSLSLTWIFQLPVHFHMHCVPKWWEFFWFCVKIFVGFGVIYALDSEE